MGTAGGRPCLVIIFYLYLGLAGGDDDDDNDGNDNADSNEGDVGNGVMNADGGEDEGGC